jgi:A/G-specific adenine glycosylase
MDTRYLSKKVVEWYEENMRSLPWRSTNDPYKIWISEIILQQTRVIQGLNYYKKFVKTFPNVRSLASAKEEEVLRLWQGLGYYTRARNMHKCAKVIVSNYDCKFPTTLDELKKLPGIGDYTGAAVASIAFNQPVAAVDGNVYRVLSRLFGIDLPINGSEGKHKFKAIASQLIPKRNPGTHNQAMMEFGALQCVPVNPDCKGCALKKHCIANAQGKQQLYPVKERKVKITNRYFYYYVIQRDRSLLMKRRSNNDIWNGLYDFYLVEKEAPSNPKMIVREDPFLKTLIVDKKNLTITQPQRHILSHQIIEYQFVHLRLGHRIRENGDKMRFYGLKTVDRLPKPVLIAKYLQNAGFL